MWAADPVKCWSRLPKTSSVPIRRSTLRPECVSTLAAASPPRRVSAERPWVASASASSAGLSVVAIRSRSLQVSAQRRAEPGDLDPLRHAHLQQVTADLIRDRQDLREEQPLADAVLGHPLERGEDVLLRLGPEAANARDPALLGGLLELDEVLDPDLVVDPAGGLGAEARDAGHLHQRRRELLLQLVRRGDAARLDQRLDLLGEGLADVGQLGQPPLLGELLDRDRALRDRPRGLPVGEDAEAIGAVELVEDSKLPEGGGYLCVAHT